MGGGRDGLELVCGRPTFAFGSKVRLFADNIAIYFVVSNIQDAQILQKDLDQLHEGELQLDIGFNPSTSKCGVIQATS